ncbi:hypothetical protein CDAR_171511 [Caerostris darwini]|uniref:Uncharacterized protein n=1 Tax=Caerostris darwini TaxID=1538125 RepID=A0AAV4WQ96_9ARAC|nr:hypothetical protein CDAR_171511 [Caerostris darwini]
MNCETKLCAPPSPALSSGWRKNFTLSSKPTRLQQRGIREIVCSLLFYRNPTSSSELRGLTLDESEGFMFVWGKGRRLEKRQLSLLVFQSYFDLQVFNTIWLVAQIKLRERI